MRHPLWKQLRAAAGKTLSFIYWSTAACLILGGASGALVLVATFLFPFLPFLGFLFVAQLAGVSAASRSSQDTQAASEHASLKPQPVEASRAIPV